MTPSALADPKRHPAPPGTKESAHPAPPPRRAREGGRTRPRTLAAAALAAEATRGAILRDPAAAAESHFDLIVIGGGILGIMTALEATRHGLRPLLLERGDFGSGTSHASLRILHGGLRYLQTLDLARCRESLRERAFWLREFPDLTRPLACLMPLHGDGLHRAPVFRMALTLNDQLCRVFGAAALPPGRILEAAEAKDLMPLDAPAPAAAVGLWYDGLVPGASRLCIEALRWAAAEGAVALNYVAAERCLVDGATVRGVEARDLETGESLVFEAPAVINAAGDGARSFLERSGVVAVPSLEPRLLAWNVLIDRPASAAGAVALRTPRPGAQTHFAVPWHGRVCIGTGYAEIPPAAGTPKPTAPSPEQLDHFLEAVNEALPGHEIGRGEIVRVFTGVLPKAANRPEPSDRPTLVAHGRERGPDGLFSVAAVKLTTARALAERVVRAAWPEQKARPDFHRTVRTPAPRPAPDPAGPDLATAVTRAHEEESALHLDDVVLRRLDLGDQPEAASALGREVCRRLGWNESRTRQELHRLHAALGRKAPATSRPAPAPAEAPDEAVLAQP